MKNIKRKPLNILVTLITVGIGLPAHADPADPTLPYLKHSSPPKPTGVRTYNTHWSPDDLDNAARLNQMKYIDESVSRVAVDEKGAEWLPLYKCSGRDALGNEANDFTVYSYKAKSGQPQMVLSGKINGKEQLEWTQLDSDHTSEVREVFKSSKGSLLISAEWTPKKDIVAGIVNFGGRNYGGQSAIDVLDRIQGNGKNHFAVFATSSGTKQTLECTQQVPFLRMKDNSEDMSFMHMLYRALKLTKDQISDLDKLAMDGVCAVVPKGLKKINPFKPKPNAKKEKDCGCKTELVKRPVGKKTEKQAAELVDALQKNDLLAILEREEREGSKSTDGSLTEEIQIEDTDQFHYPMHKGSKHLYLLRKGGLKHKLLTEESHLEERMWKKVPQKKSDAFIQHEMRDEKYQDPKVAFETLNQAFAISPRAGVKLLNKMVNLEVSKHMRFISMRPDMEYMIYFERTRGAPAQLTEGAYKAIQQALKRKAEVEQIQLERDLELEKLINAADSTKTVNQMEGLIPEEN